MSELFAWISHSALGAWIVSSGYIWPTLESLHFVSLCVRFGSILVIDLRLIGFYRSACASMVDVLTRFALAAFAVNLATGVLFFAGNTYKYVGNAAFEVKLLLIVAAGINAWFYKARLSRIVQTEAVTLGTISVGSLSIFFWIGVIVCGRMITFYAP